MTLTIGATGGGTATRITFGDGTGGTVKSLNELNAALAANNLQASVSTRPARSRSRPPTTRRPSTIGRVGGTAAAPARLQRCWQRTAPVADPAAQAIRSNLVAQYNNIIAQITTTSQDSSFNGINLLNGDNLKLTFNETGKSTLNIRA